MMGEQYTLPVYEDEPAGTEYQAVIGSMSSTLTGSALSSILVYGVGACVGMVLFWWAIRKVGGMFMRAFKKGKMRI